MTIERGAARRTVLVMTVGLAIASCGGSDDEAAPSVSASASMPNTVASTAPATTTEPVTTMPNTTVPPTTPVTTTPVTTTPVTTAPATSGPVTTLPAVGAWEPVEFFPAVVPVGYSGNFEGEPSPPAPAGDEASLADGYYHAQLTQLWTPTEPDVLHVEIRGLAPCTDVPEMCNENPDGPPELGIDPSWERFVDVPLDDSTRVVVRGFRCFPEPGGTADEAKSGRGTDLADLFDSYATDVETTIEPLLPGTSENYELEMAVVEALAGSTEGFVPEPDICDVGDGGGGGPLRYVHGNAPVLLLQYLFQDGSDPALVREVSDVVALQGVDVVDGVMTLYFYAGFYS